ncbi:MAG: STAS-like domain-containing protein [Gallionella sp.]|nr:STAS-like domain-containing protein [Gallionella sp.]
MIESKINVARDFSKYPAGRYLADGPASGQFFREKFLIPTLKAAKKLTIELDGTRGYGSSFLEEAFGGAVREGFAADIVKQTFVLISDDQSLVEEIRDYIEHGSDPE